MAPLTRYLFDDDFRAAAGGGRRQLIPDLAGESEEHLGLLAVRGRGDDRAARVGGLANRHGEGDFTRNGTRDAPSLPDQFADSATMPATAP